MRDLYLRFKMIFLISNNVKHNYDLERPSSLKSLNVLSDVGSDVGSDI